MSYRHFENNGYLDREVNVCIKVAVSSYQFIVLKGCDFYSVCGGVFGLTSIATMASISLNRLSAVNDPFSSLKLSARSTLR